jgi:dethiobiotin synthetase
MQLVIAGTDTDVGKTIVSALVVQGLGAHYWKPVQSGLADGSDRARVQQLLGLPVERLLPEAYRFQAPVSPHWAARMEGVRIDPAALALPAVEGALVVECAGGLMVPLCDNAGPGAEGAPLLQIDQLVVWGLPVLLVARSGLGTLNHTLLSLDALRHRAIPVLGLVLNGPLHPDNPRTLEVLGGVPVLAQLPPLEPMSAAGLQEQWLASALPTKLCP